MKKAVLYARVSTEVQQKEGTIQSQVIELKRQIVEAGDVLVKEYVDDGHSGAKLDRPALNQLRKDLKTDLFDTIYFLNTDRVARDVAYQNIIIAEILRYKKQVILNGKDYIHNPENKFELTVLGAVSELERAKIIERSQRGKMHRLRQGFMLGNGYNVYGYDYIPRSLDIPSKLVIKEAEAKVVRYIFETFVKDEVGINQISRHLEECGLLTKTGGKLWNVDGLKRVLRNHTYVGIKYFNRKTRAKEAGNPLHKTKYGKMLIRDKSEWIGIKVPAIVSQELFDQAQAKLERNGARYRSPRQKQLLCNLIECGECGCHYYSYQRYYREKRVAGTTRICHKVAYSCNGRATAKMHLKRMVTLCHNPEIKAQMLEDCVLEIIRNITCEPDRLRVHMDFFKQKERANQFKIEKQLLNIEDRINALYDEKKNIVDYYATGKTSQEEYVERNIQCDKEINDLKAKKAGLIERIPLLHKTEVVEVSIRRYCETLKARLERATDFDGKRQLLLNYIEKVIFIRDAVTVIGSVPIKLQAYADPDQLSEVSKIEFRIEGRINRKRK